MTACCRGMLLVFLRHCGKAHRNWAERDRIESQGKNERDWVERQRMMRGNQQAFLSVQYPPLERPS